MKKATYKRIAENLALNGYREELDDFELEAMYIALEESHGGMYDDVEDFKKKLRKAHRADPWYQAA